jgi:hypothetical protein
MTSLPLLFCDDGAQQPPAAASHILYCMHPGSSRLANPPHFVSFKALRIFADFTITFHVKTAYKMGKNAELPDAWDDDWESQADKAEAQAESSSGETQAKISKADRLAKHAETNKKIWESAYAINRLLTSTPF